MTDCIHHWIIKESTSPTSTGKCKHCGATRVFCNSLTFEAYLNPRYVPDSLTTGKRGKKLIKER